MVFKLILFPVMQILKYFFSKCPQCNVKCTLHSFYSHEKISVCICVHSYFLYHYTFALSEKDRVRSTFYSRIQPNTHLTLSSLFRPLHKNSFLNNVRTQNQVRKGIWWQLSSFLSNMDTCIPKSSNSSRGYDYNLFQSSNEDEGIIRGRESSELYRNKLHNMKKGVSVLTFFSHLSKEKLRQQDTPQEIQNDEVSGTT